MSTQNANNHGRYVPVWHFITPLIILIILGMCIINVVHSDMNARDPHMWLPIIFMPIVMLTLWWYARAFALRAQDRAIRAEENLRHYIITGKPLPKELRMGQIIALRFASDGEFPALVQKAVAENLDSKTIKQSIKNWKEDHNRV